MWTVLLAWQVSLWGLWVDRAALNGMLRGATHWKAEQPA